MCEMKRDTFIMYRSLHDAAKRLSKEDRADFYDAVFSYALDGIECTNDGIAGGMFILVKPVLESNRKNWANGSKPKKAPIENEAKDNTKISEIEAKGKRNISKAEAEEEEPLGSLLRIKDKDLDNDKEIKGGKPQLSNIETLAINESKFKKEVLAFTDFDNQTLLDFFSYWSEPNKSNTKMLWEMKPTFDIKRRLGTWAKNNYNGERNKQISGAIQKGSRPTAEEYHAKPDFN